MTFSLPAKRRFKAGFSLVEALLTIAIMSILTSLVVSTVSNASKDAARMIARQQQGAVKTAVDAWVTSQMRDTTTGQAVSLAAIRTIYNNQTSSLAKLNKVKDFLDDGTADHFTSSTTNSDAIKSDALNKVSQHLELPTWDSTGFPKVNLADD